MLRFPVKLRCNISFVYLVDSPGVEPGPRQPAPLDIYVDLGRIELPSPQCECGVLPLYYKPKGEGRMPRNTVLLWAPSVIPGSRLDSLARRARRVTRDPRSRFRLFGRNDKFCYLENSAFTLSASAFNTPLSPYSPLCAELP